MSFYSGFFQLKQVKQGIYAAIVKDGTGALGNAGFVDLGNQTIVFDTFQSTLAAKDLKQMAEEITEKPVTFVINSHWHYDHVMGNQIFHDATIISTCRTRELIYEKVAGFLTFAKANRDYPQLLQEEANREKNPAKRAELLRNAGDTKHVASLIDTYILTLPHLTFKNELTIHGSARKAVLLNLGGGHSEDDTLLYLPDDKVAFMGDLLFNKYHLTLKSGNPDHWLQIIDQISGMDIETYIPGHGDLATRTELELNRNYIKQLQQMLAKAKLQRTSQEELLNQPVPEPYQNWFGSSVFADNLQFLYQCKR
ncbi:MBL fold metallo-hydrolase [Paenactinomyces guangxiensis]|uniref:MBL fold metallo-hydrolase n=1 Tax=Paenactinomyces guangxiensis TaxID=1490290 RepID=A0A7W1WQY4_9BACL|nr:MBL fold metallo-hydrolase [Paenactinomyces guangxiensis]MBA4494457.1 MBL fold metallo-hydrolase [Paenactinomyces guangxiensis]MBH8591488.1 MBL fold metallo-hydrolase [Paenactinomyces guangxiensis]